MFAENSFSVTDIKLQFVVVLAENYVGHCMILHVVHDNIFTVQICHVSA